jgi:GntR family transcriptional regulator, arabinose operon transcriptional repressor
MNTENANSKHQTICGYLRKQIQAGEFGPGQRLPSEAQLGRRFSASRATVGKALRELELRGVITRRRGSGSFVQTTSDDKPFTFGLLVPGLSEGEIFEPICNAIAATLAHDGHHLLWGRLPADTPEGRSENVVRLCRQYLTQHVDGLFYAPLELTPSMDAANTTVANLIGAAKIPAVLLDQDLCPFPQRSGFDLVGVDNRRIGYRLAQHFLELGCRRIVFFARCYSAHTVEARIAGYQEALRDGGLPGKAAQIIRGEPNDEASLSALLSPHPPDAVICGNDFTAAVLMGELLRRGVRVPQEVRMSGVDDLKYASFLAVPLTTVRQPCTAMAQAAVEAMLRRRLGDRSPPRDILFETELLVRASSGAAKLETVGVTNT